MRTVGSPLASGLLALSLLALPHGFAPRAAAAQGVPDAAALKREAAAEIDRMQTLTQQMVDQIFSFAELGFQEVETSRYVTALLEQNRFRVRRGVADIPTAWVAEYGAGKPVIAFITDIDGIPKASQKPGVAYHAPLVEGAPGHGEGHNSGQAVNVTAALALQKLLDKYKLPGTIRILPGVAEELLATKAFLVRAGLFRDVDIVLGSHVSSEFATNWGSEWLGAGLVSVQYDFHGQASHAAWPWQGRSALDAVELMNAAWNMRREHLRLQHRSHYVITNGGDQPNVVPPEASVWYYFRELDYQRIRSLYETANKMSEAAAAMSETSVTRRLVGSAWPCHFNRAVAEAQQKNIEAVGMPQWSEADLTLARELQRQFDPRPPAGLLTRVTPLGEPREAQGGGSDDIGDISWNVPTVYLRYPANIPSIPGHHWAAAVAMATPIAHKGSTAGAKVQAMTALDFLLSPALVAQAWAYFRDVQTREIKYTPLIAPEDKPAVEMNREKVEKFLPELRKHYYDPTKYKTYLEQLGIRYPTVKKP
jgi:aminobenzoyl-glutamate utilization protein B